MENWNILKERLTEQIEDCRKHEGSSGSWNVITRVYRAVLGEMERIENGTYADYKPMNGLWGTPLNK